MFKKYILVFLTLESQSHEAATLRYICHKGTPQLLQNLLPGLTAAVQDGQRDVWEFDLDCGL